MIFYLSKLLDIVQEYRSICKSYKKISENENTIEIKRYKEKLRGYMKAIETAEYILPVNFKAKKRYKNGMILREISIEDIREIRHMIKEPDYAFLDYYEDYDNQEHFEKLLEERDFSEFKEEEIYECLQKYSYSQGLISGLKMILDILEMGYTDETDLEWYEFDDNLPYVYYENDDENQYEDKDKYEDWEDNDSWDDGE